MMLKKELLFLMNINKQLKENRVLPLATITSKEEVDGISQALQKANCSVLEITLRDERVREIIHLFKNYPDLTIGLGTIRSSEDIDLAVSSGAHFGITPGLSKTLCEYANDCNFQLIPGVQSASEIMLASELGYKLLKFFPAELSGGAKKLKAMQAVFPDISFVPTGGVNSSNFNSYLALTNVVCVGSSDLISNEMLNSNDWNGISSNIINIKENLL